MNDIELSTLNYKSVYLINPNTGVLWGMASVPENEILPDRHIIDPAPPVPPPIPGYYDVVWNKETKKWKIELTDIGRLTEWSKIKSRRTELLAATDWTQMADVALSPEKKTAVNEYRQSLRDITTKFVNPDEVVWPVCPL